jgi:hypothetical protein
MQNLPFETVGLTGDDVQTLEDTYALLKEKFEVGLPCNVEFPMHEFDVFTNSKDIKVSEVLAISHPANSCYLVFLRVHIYYNPVKSGGEIVDYYKYQVWGFIKSKKDYGRVLIRRETFADKIAGLIHPVELEFKDDKAFNHKYYVVTNDKEKALAALGWNLRNAIMDIKNESIMIETAENFILIGNGGWADKDEIIYLADVVAKIASVS